METFNGVLRKSTGRQHFKRCKGDEREQAKAEVSLAMRDYLGSMVRVLESMRSLRGMRSRSKI